eukprot:scaffold7541_cov46-Tisochrysis_lutea.AAC.1
MRRWSSASSRGHFWCVKNTLELFKGHQESASALVAFVNRTGATEHRTALIMAAMGGHAHIVLELLNAGGKIAAMDDGGYTSLMHA